MRNRLDKGRIREITSSILYYSSFIGFGLILGILIFSEYLAWRVFGISCCDIPRSEMIIYRNLVTISWNTILSIFALKILMLCCYSLLKGRKLKSLVFVNILSLSITFLKYVLDGTRLCICSL